MAKFRSIQTNFWSDSKIVDDFSPEDRYFYLYLLTNEKSNQLGCYELSIKQMCRDTGYNDETIQKLLDRFENKLNVINYDYKTKEIFIKNWYKYNWLNSYSTKVCIEKEFSLVKSGFLKDLLGPLYAPYIPPTGNKKKKNNKNKKKKNNKKNSDSVTSLTLNDILEYAKELDLNDDDYCERFYNYYESIGWVTGTGQKIKNWKLVFKNWLKKDENKSKEENKEYKEVDGGFKF